MQKTPAWRAGAFDDETNSSTSFYDQSFCASTIPKSLLGDLARFFYSAAPRPVPEFAIAGAIAILAGIAGRAYNVSDNGLNQYIIVVADTGRGKEAIASGISKLVAAIIGNCPAIAEFIGPSEIASPQALIKWLSRTPCIVSIVGEFGLKLKEMSSERAPAHLAGMKRILLDLYGKSSHGALAGAMAYADREKNTSAINAPSFTLIGESTPQRVFEHLSEEVIADGLLPRFLLFSYEGDQGALSKTHMQIQPSNQLLADMSNLIALCAANSSHGKVCNVQMSPEAQELLDRFETYARHCVNNRDPQTGQKLPTKSSSVVMELWNRAHLKAIKLAALCAVGVHPVLPCVDAEQAQWAINLVSSQTEFLIAKFAAGDMGAIENNETLRRNAVIRAINNYAETAFEKLPKYGLREDLHARRIIPKSYLQRSLGDTAAFRKAIGGATKALDLTLKNMVEAGELQEISKMQMQNDYGTRATAYAIANASAFLKPNENIPKTTYFF